MAEETEVWKGYSGGHRKKRRLPSWQRGWIERKGVYQVGRKGG
jgi:hypothetical protein